MPSYYVENSHPAIIEPLVFDLAQTEFKKRSRNTGFSGNSLFASKIKCGECGGWFGAKVWHSNTKYRRVIYRCNRKYDADKCATPHVTEEEIKAAFLKALNRLIDGKGEIIANTTAICQTLCDTASLEKEKEILAL